MFKEKLNLLFYKDILEFITDYDTKYIIMNFYDDLYFVRYEPSIYIGKIDDIKSLICYDYDQLDNDLKLKYCNEFRSFTKVKDNIYKMNVKKYKIKRK